MVSEHVVVMCGHFALDSGRRHIPVRPSSEISETASERVYRENLSVGKSDRKQPRLGWCCLSRCTGHVAYLIPCLLAGRNRMGGAKLAGDLHLGRIRVDGDDRMGRTQARALEDVETDSTAAKDHYALAGGDVYRVDRGADTGGHGAADEGGPTSSSLSIPF